MREPGTEFDLNLPPRTALACMSETMILALENRLEPYTLGRGIELKKIIEIDAMAERCGFTLAGHARLRRRDHVREDRRHQAQRRHFQFRWAAPFDGARDKLRAVLSEVRSTEAKE